MQVLQGCFVTTIILLDALITSLETVGFFALAMIGAILYVAPRLLGPKVDWACVNTNRWVYRLIALGAVIMVTAGVGMSWKHGKGITATLVDEPPAGHVYSVQVVYG